MKAVKKSVSIILAVFMAVSVFVIAPFTIGAAENSKLPTGNQVTDNVKENWKKLKNFLLNQTDQKYSYDYEESAHAGLAFPRITSAKMSLSDNRVKLSYSYEAESYEEALSICEVDINKTSTVEGHAYLDRGTTYTKDYTFWGDYTVGLENCYSPSEYTLSNVVGILFGQNGVAFSPARDYTPTNEEFEEVFSANAKRIETLVLKPALNLTLNDLGFGVPAVPEPETTDISKCSVSGIKNKTYTGNAQTQSVTVKDGTKALKSGTDYSVSYKDNKNAGTATMTITGKGNYTGSVKKTFKISKADNPVKVSAKASVTANSKKATTIKKAVTVSKAQGAVSYSTNNKKVTVKSGTMTIAKGLKKGKTISVKVTATAKGNSNYKSKKIVKTIKIKVK